MPSSSTNMPRHEAIPISLTEYQALHFSLTFLFNITAPLAKDAGNTRRPLQTLFIRDAGCWCLLAGTQRALGGLTPAQCGNYDAHIN
jgi:hypothetical protein